MPRELAALPGAQVGENRPAGFLELLLDLGNFLFERNSRMLFEFIQFPLQVDYWFLELEIMFHCASNSLSTLPHFPPP